MLQRPKQVGDPGGLASGMTGSTKRVADNMPYDKIVAGLVLATSRPKGQSYDAWVQEQADYVQEERAATGVEVRRPRDDAPLLGPRQNFRKPEERVIGFSYAFLGVRLECAQCHKHPFDQWTQDDFNRFGAFFNAVGFGVAPDAREPSFQQDQPGDRASTSSQGGEQEQASSSNSDRRAKISPWQEVFVNRNGQAAKRRRRQADAAGPRRAGSSRPRCSAATRSPSPGSTTLVPTLDGLAPEQGQPVFRQGVRQPGLGQRTSAWGSSTRPTT